VDAVVALVVVAMLAEVVAMVVVAVALVVARHSPGQDFSWTPHTINFLSYFSDLHLHYSKLAYYFIPPP
jgi:hypothetical protein